MARVVLNDSEEAVELVYRSIMEQCGAIEADAWLSSFQFSKLKGQNACPVIHLNNYWRTFFWKSSDNTSYQRNYLCDTNDVGSWFDNFKAFVLPYVTHLRRQGVMW